MERVHFWLSRVDQELSKWPWLKDVEQRYGVPVRASLTSKSSPSMIPQSFSD